MPVQTLNIALCQVYHLFSRRQGRAGQGKYLPGSKWATIFPYFRRGSDREMEHADDP